MAVILDTHVLIALFERAGEGLPAGVLAAANEDAFASVASLWEMAIKSRLGKLPLKTPLARIPGALDELGLRLLPIDERHALAELEFEPIMRDPFDRMLLAQCQVEGMRLVTLDRALLQHTLAWRS
jgi:PIN domain nuclease of toxin-antitoxin system